MARKKAEAPTTSPELGRRLTELHAQAGSPTFDDMAFEIRTRFGYRITAEMIRRAHRGLLNVETCAVEVLSLLCRYYDIKASELGDDVVRRVEVDLLVTGGVNVRSNARAA